MAILNYQILRMRTSIFILSLVCFANVMFGQETTDSVSIALQKELKEYENHSYSALSFNVSPLLFELIPLKQSPTKSGPIDLAYSWGYKQHAFRLGLGFNINTSSDGLSRGVLRIGYENNKSLTPKIRYYSSFDFWIGGGDLNLPNVDATNGEVLGLSTGLGIQYFIHDFIFIGSESNLFLGFNDGFALLIMPPVSVFLGIRI